MTNASDHGDFQSFGRLVRLRRQALGLSQEALAEAALGNPDRKSFISAVENNRLTKITPNTAKRLCAALGLLVEDVPASLRWPSSHVNSPIEERLRALETQIADAHQPSQSIDNRAIAQFLNAQMAAIMRRPISHIFLQRLSRGLRVLRTWTGSPYSAKSFLACYAVSLLYLVGAGLVSFFQGDIILGSVRPYRALEWIDPSLKPVLPYLGCALLVGSFVWCLRLVRSFGVRPMSETETAARLGSVALVAGLCCGVVDYLGTTTMTAAAVFSVPSIGAISTLQPGRAAIYGASGGILFGVMAAVSSGLSDNGIVAFLTSIAEGIIIGGIVGGCAGLVGSLIAQRVPHLRSGQLVAAGGGIGFGAIVSLVGILIAMNFSAISEGMLGLFALSWLVLPVANAALDYVSLGVSHMIGRRIVHSRPRSLVVVAALLFDLGLAVTFMVLTVAVVGLALSGVTLVLGIDTLSSVFLQESAEDPWGSGLWLTTMALSTTLWTWLHFGFVLAPMASGILVQKTLERTAQRRLAEDPQAGQLDVIVGLLIPARLVLFYSCWALVALLPAMILARYPDAMKPVLYLGWQLFGFF